MLQKVFTMVGIVLIGMILIVFIVLGCSYMIGKSIIVPSNHVQNT